MRGLNTTAPAAACCDAHQCVPRYGHVSECNVSRDDVGRSKGFGYVPHDAMVSGALPSPTLLPRAASSSSWYQRGPSPPWQSWMERSSRGVSSTSFPGDPAARPSASRVVRAT